MKKTKRERRFEELEFWKKIEELKYMGQMAQDLGEKVDAEDIQDIIKEMKYNRKHSGKMDKVIAGTTPKLKKTLGSRLREEPFVLEPSEMAGGGGGKFLGLPLPLLPDISKSIVEVGEEHSLLKIYGIEQRNGTKVSLFRGPNRKANRYLRYQYSRMLEAIGGTLDPMMGGAKLTQKTFLSIEAAGKLQFVNKFGQKQKPRLF